MLSHLNIAHKFWEMVLAPGDLAVDATAGNGHDSLFLAGLIPEGTLHAFDIQEEALEATRNRLAGFSKVFIHNMCHSRMAEVIAPQSAKVIAFNLGYLPGGDKSRTTTTPTSLKAIEASLALLAPGGLLSITCYPGHDEGAQEDAAITAFCQSLDPHLWTVQSLSLLNRPKHPHLLLIQHRYS